MSEKPQVSVIVPVHNASRYLHQCLDALLSSSYEPLEIIVIDDGSLDNSAEIGHRKGAVVFRLPVQSGPAAARNFGARQAKGEILLFVDSDVVVKADAIARVIESFCSDPETVAVFGSYDDDPAEKDFFSQYKNLFHHFVHQHSSSNAVTFWAGCGAIRRTIFDAIEGFDDKQYPRPSIEDIELGVRLTLSGYRILLDKRLQVKHLKKWTFISLLKTDVCDRALPWSRLILERKHIVKDLNLQTSHRISAGLVGLSSMMAPLIMLELQMVYVLAACLLVIFSLNWRLYKFFYCKRGITFAASAFPIHFIYYLYSGITFLACWCTSVVTRTLHTQEQISASSKPG